MAPESELSEYERRRLENIKRNEEMLAKLNVRSRAQQLKPLRPHTNKSVNSGRKRKTEEPTVVRRSLRSHAPPVDESAVCVLKQDIIKSPKKKKLKAIAEPLKERLSRGPVPFSMRDAYIGKGSDEKLVELIKHFTSKCEMSVNDVSTESAVKKEEVGDLDGEDVKDENVVLGSVAGEKTVVDMNIKTGFSGAANTGDWDLKPQNVARLSSTKITTMKFLPTADRTLVVVGNVSGDVGIWDVGVEDNEEGSDNGIYMYDPHSAQVSAIVVEPFSMSKIYTSSYDGYIRSMDMEKQLFDLVHLTDYPVYSMSARPQDLNSLYFSEASGEFDIWDLRTGKSPATWNLHEYRINSIEFNSQNTNLMATSSSDCTVAVWDLRYLRADSPKPLNIIEIGRPVYSAYFSPSGRFIATTSVDVVGISSGANFEDTSMVEHGYNPSLQYRAIWGWDDSKFFIGNVKRRIKVVSVASKETVASLKDEKMTGVPYLLDAHRYREGMLAAATANGKVFVWTSN